MTLNPKYHKALYIVGTLVILSMISVSSIYIYNYVVTLADNQQSCNVLGIELRGDITTYIPTDHEENNIEGYEDAVSSDEIMYSLSDAEQDDTIKAILIEVDSYGGYPVAGEEIAHQIKSSTKPVVAFIRGAGLSAAYLAISPSDRIFASRNSDVGSIGVTMSYLENVKSNEMEGFTFVPISVGKYKDAGNPDKSLTEEEKSLFMRDTKILHENFMEDVSVNRNIPLEKVRLFADGSSVLGNRAKELGMIDEIGGYGDALEYIKGIIGEEVEVCW